MEDFSIMNRITAKEYSKITFIGLYKKPTFILSTIIGLYLFVTVILDQFNILNYYADTPYFELFTGLFILLGPTLITAIAYRQFISNPGFRNDIKYTFSEKGIAIEGATFSGAFLWAHFIKRKEIGNFLVLYQSKKNGNIIDKSKLTLEQLNFIKSKIGQK